MLAGKDGAYPSGALSGAPLKVLHSTVGRWPYPQTLDLAGKACQGETLKFFK